MSVLSLLSGADYRLPESESAVTIVTNHSSVIVLPHASTLAYNRASDAYLACEISYRDPFNARKDYIPASKVSDVIERAQYSL